MLTAFVREINAVLEKHDFEPGTIQSVMLDGATRHVEIIRFVTGPSGKKVLDLTNGQPLLTRETYSMLVPDAPFDEGNLTAEQVMAQPVGTVIAGSDGVELTRRLDGRYANDDDTDVVVDVEQFVGSGGPVRLVKRGGE